MNDRNGVEWRVVVYQEARALVGLAKGDPRKSKKRLRREVFRARWFKFPRWERLRAILKSSLSH